MAWAIVAWASDRAEANAEARAMVVLVALALEGGPRRWRQALATRAAMRRVVVGLPRSSRVAAAVALIEAQRSVLGVVLRVLGQQRGASSMRRRASPIDQ